MTHSTPSGNASSLTAPEAEPYVLAAELAHEGVEMASVNAAHEKLRGPFNAHSREPAGAVISPLTWVFAAALAAAGYALSKRLGKGHDEASWSIPPHRAGVAPVPVERAASSPSTEGIRSRTPFGRGVSVLGAGVKGASLLARHVPAKWATLGVAATGVLTKWRQKKAEYEMADAIAKVEADVRALRRMSRSRRR